MVVRGRANAAETENHVRSTEATAQGFRKALGIVAQVLRPGKAQPPLGEGCDYRGEMLVFALSDEDFVPDDESAEQSGCLFRPALELLEPANVLAIDEYLRNRAAPGDGADDARAVAVVELHFRESIAELL